MKLKTLLFCSLLALGFVSCGGDDNDDNENGSGSTSTEVINGHKFVNLGLPSGTLWAETNVGAKSKSDIGDYYAWGEIETKDSYKESNYKCQKDIMVVFCYQKMMLPHKNGVLACIYQPRSKHKSL